MTARPSTSTLCTGRGEPDGDHCCYLNNVPCKFIVDTGVPGDGRFRCALMMELKSWNRVHKDARYKAIGEYFTQTGTGLCGDWQPGPKVCCRKAR